MSYLFYLYVLINTKHSNLLKQKKRKPCKNVRLLKTGSRTANCCYEAKPYSYPAVEKTRRRTKKNTRTLFGTQIYLFRIICIPTRRRHYGVPWFSLYRLSCNWLGRTKKVWTDLFPSPRIFWAFLYLWRNMLLLL